MKGAIAVLVLVIVIAVGAALAGWRVKGMSDIAKDAATARKTDKVRQRRNRQALAVGVRTEQAQDDADTFFQQLRTRYDEDQHNHPGAGCVLDADSLRVWNAANAKSSDAAASQPDDGVPSAAATETEPEPGD